MPLLSLMQNNTKTYFITLLQEYNDANDLHREPWSTGQYVLAYSVEVQFRWARNIYTTTMF